MEEEKEIVVKKKKRGLKGLLMVIGVIGVVVLILGILFPGLLWTKSLGVAYTEEDYKSIMNKLNYTKDKAPTEGVEEDYEYVYGENTSVNMELTSEEITSFFNENRPDYYALKDVQVKVNESSIEATGSINVDYVIDEILSNRISREEIQEEIPALGLLPKNVNLYLDFSGSVNNNKANPVVNSVSVQGIPIPKEYVASSEAINTITDGLNNLMDSYSKKTNSNFNSIKIEDGKVNFEGSVPTSLERIKK